MNTTVSTWKALLFFQRFTTGLTRIFHEFYVRLHTIINLVAGGSKWSAFVRGWLRFSYLFSLLLEPTGNANLAETHNLWCGFQPVNGFKKKNKEKLRTRQLGPVELASTRLYQHDHERDTRSCGSCEVDRKVVLLMKCWKSKKVKRKQKCWEHLADLTKSAEREMLQLEWCYCFRSSENVPVGPVKLWKAGIEWIWRECFH